MVEAELLSGRASQEGRAHMHGEAGAPRWPSIIRMQSSATPGSEHCRYREEGERPSMRGSCLNSYHRRAWGYGRPREITEIPELTEEAMNEGRAPISLLRPSISCH
ncbi:hypothetical protein Dimus_022338, partial [Dionaea muscipula]